MIIASENRDRLGEAAYHALSEMRTLLDAVATETSPIALLEIRRDIATIERLLQRAQELSTYRASLIPQLLERTSSDVAARGCCCDTDADACPRSHV